MSSNTKTVLLCGVGGQGTILAADLLAVLPRRAEKLDVKVSEIHGIAQRGGAVTTVVRFADKVQSMIADLGSADCVVSFGKRPRRFATFLREGGSLFVNDESTIKPLPVATGRASCLEHARERLRDAVRCSFPHRVCPARRVPPRRQTSCCSVRSHALSASRRMYGIGLSLPAFPRSTSMSTSRRSSWAPRFPRNKREGVFL